MCQYDMSNIDGSSAVNNEPVIFYKSVILFCLPGVLNLCVCACVRVCVRACVLERSYTYVHGYMCLSACV